LGQHTLDKSLIFIYTDLAECIFDVGNNAIVDCTYLVDQQVCHSVAVDFLFVDAFGLELTEERFPEDQYLFSEFFFQ